MIPNVDDNLITLVEKKQPGLTYAIDGDRIRGKIDGLEALKQSIYLALNTERFKYLIYSWNYGAELSDLIGQPREYVLPEIKRRITEVLKQDDRIAAVDNFSFANEKNSVHVTFTVHSDLGEMEVETIV